MAFRNTSPGYGAGGQPNEGGGAGGWLPAPTQNDPGAIDATATFSDAVRGIEAWRKHLRGPVSRRRADRVAADGKITALTTYASGLQTQLSNLANLRYGADVLNQARKRAESPSSTPGTLDVTGIGAGARVTGPAAEGVDEALQRARQSLFTASQKTLTRSHHLGKAQDDLALVELAVLSAELTIDQLTDIRDRRWQAQTSELQHEVARVRTGVDQLIDALHSSIGARSTAAHPGWEPASWSQWSAPGQVEPINLGWLEIARDGALEDWAGLGAGALPVTLDIRSAGGIHLRGDAARRDALNGAARGLIARLLAAVPPGKARFTFFDPLGLGQIVSPFLALGDHDSKLIDGKVWSNGADLRARLTDLTSHIEVVIQKYLRGEYSTIEQFNAAAGEISEAYRILVVFDFPSQFDDTTFHQLCRIIENGPRCGVFTVLVTNDSIEVPYGVSLQNLPRSLPTIDPRQNCAVISGGQRIGAGTVLLDQDPLQAVGVEAGQRIIDRIVDQVGKQGRGADNVTVTFARALDHFANAALTGVRSDLPTMKEPVRATEPNTWWTVSSRDSLVAPLGQSGARDVAALRLDSEINSGALLVGRPGAGKSTLLHSYVAGVCTLYAPEEVELYLIDFKEGVEFKAYGELALPHARCVAIESDREFGLNVLESIVSEMRRRAELIRSAGGQYSTFGRARDAASEPLPRIVLVFDEFHVLFAEDDKLGARAADLLETIVRQGRGFGVHVLLGSQSLSGLDALPRHVLQLLPVRILLPSSEADAALVLGEGNPAWRLLGRRGEGVLNAEGGAVEANVPFQGAFLTEDERLARLRALRKMADSRGFRRKPVVFEGHGAARLDEAGAAGLARDLIEASTSLPTLRIGDPLGLASPVGITLRRESGANVLVVAKSAEDVALGVVLSGLLSALAWARRPAIHIIDFTSIDDGFEEVIDPLLSEGVTISRKRTSAQVLSQLAGEVQRRIDADDVRAAPVLFTLWGIHRARELEGPGGDDFSFDDDVDFSANAADSLRQILTDGPEVGVHTLAWCDSVAAVRRRLPGGSSKEFGFRIAGPMSRDDSVELLDSDAAASCRTHQVVVLDDVNNTLDRATAYANPDARWVRDLISHLKEGRS